MALNVGSRLGHYDVTALIGEGGMGQVYQATDTSSTRIPFGRSLAGDLDREASHLPRPDGHSHDVLRCSHSDSVGLLPLSLRTCRP